MVILLHVGRGGVWLQESIRRFMQTLLRLGEEEERENDWRKQEVARVSMKRAEKRNRKFTR